MPTPCANGCPFYGTPQTDNLCSACFRLAQPSSGNSCGNSKCVASTSSNVSAAVPGNSPGVASTCTPTATPTPTLTPSTSNNLEETCKNATPLSIPQPFLPPTCTAPPEQQISSPSPSQLGKQQSQDEADEEQEQQHQQVQSSAKSIPKNRCYVCRKKLGLTPFVCRCARAFCSSHRMPNVHACEFDFKAHHRNVLTRANPAVIAKKLDKI